MTTHEAAKATRIETAAQREARERREAAETPHQREARLKREAAETPEQRAAREAKEAREAVPSEAPTHDFHEFVTGIGDCNFSVQAVRGFVRLTGNTSGFSPEHAAEVAECITQAGAEAQAQRDAGWGPQPPPVEPPPALLDAQEREEQQKREQQERERQRARR